MFDINILSSEGSSSQEGRGYADDTSLSSSWLKLSSRVQGLTNRSFSTINNRTTLAHIANKGPSRMGTTIRVRRRPQKSIVAAPPRKSLST